MSRTVTVSHGDGTTTQHTISAYLSVSGAYVTKNVTLTIDHEEHVRAEIETQAPIERTRAELLSLSASLAADAAFRVMVYPEPEPEVRPADQRRATATELEDLPGWH